ncbi:MAG: nucleoside triphosphate pyrophosphohydrolase [Acidobacteria bacterium]|nr:nucleoside triphosphate pyrophosphohydrolase [Acidobacteriota bacterium]NIM63792.1 nucleoside triphosphate pyrophosphohydrolase [Acidobacteriota bacterium]NIO58455.1 nucleoside triphosphate pyrophosphohydrolase [Acidobacteriota bacterium]NIQ29518.1 nucleoside triphosphate pyrophosphohydrolase [Acidobacteriota bacterium]NIQ84200.1 nucleoside triphosphate pyrophosphohydrolase [Acidobacteriota bacterium]
MNDHERFGKLVEIMDQLREPGGCPWDREQDWTSLRSYLLEECHEALEALDAGNLADLREELGDLLLQIVFLSRLAQEEGAFTARDVVRGIVEKMIRRHPHVFAEESAEDADEVLRNWERIKKAEKAARGDHRSSVLDGLPQGLPSLLRALRLGEKASRVGFDWNEPADVLEKIREELEELRASVRAGDRNGTREEIGDLLFATAMLARKLDHDPESALEAANRKFTRRFKTLERRARESGQTVETLDPERLEELWNEVKAAER